MNIGKIITDKISTGEKSGFSQMELNNNIGLNNLIELIVNELKSSYILGDGPEWETKLFVQGEKPLLLLDDVRKIVEQLFSNNPKLNGMQVSRFLMQKRVPGLDFSVNRNAFEDDIVRFDFDFPELDYINRDIVNGNNKMQKQIYKKVIKPFYKYLKRNSKELDKDNSGVPLEVPKQIIDRFKKVIISNIPKGMDKQIVSEYYIYNILNLNNRQLQEALLNRQSLQVVSKSRNIIMNHRNEMENVKNLTQIQSKNNVHRSYRDIEEFKSLLSGVTAQLYMNSRTLKGKSPEEIEEILKKAYSLYTEREANDDTYQVDEYGYRTVNVGLGKKDVLLHRQGDNIKRAMENLTTSIAELIQDEPNISEEEYIKRVGMLHFRYISIHPFRDSNGRTGRNLINMLLSQKDKMFVLDRQDKNEYLTKMNEMRIHIPLQHYLYCLSENPSECRKYEESSCGELTEFLIKHIYNFTDDIHGDVQDRSMRRWEERNFGSDSNREVERTE